VELKRMQSTPGAGHPAFYLPKMKKKKIKLKDKKII
jgi:hypothetical protein